VLVMKENIIKCYLAKIGEMCPSTTFSTLSFSLHSVEHFF
jgi:hypothetical protein